MVVNSNAIAAEIFKGGVNQSLHQTIKKATMKNIDGVMNVRADIDKKDEPSPESQVETPLAATLLKSKGPLKDKEAAKQGKFILKQL